MPTRTPKSGSWATSDFIGAADLNKDAGGWVGFESRTTDLSFTTITDVTGLSVTFTAVANRRYKISVVGLIISSVANDVAQLIIADGSNTTLAVSQVVCASTSYSVQAGTFLLTQPSAGSVTYKARVFRASGTGTCTLQAAATYPAYILVEDLGPSS